MKSFKVFMEKQNKLPDYFQNKVRVETKIVVSDEHCADDELIERALILVEENIGNSDFGIDNLTESFYMSRSSLYKRLKNSTGLSPSRFIKSVRLKNAARIILEKDYQNLKEIASDVGFNDYRYFKRSFRDQYGCLPAEYKKFFLSDLYDRLVSPRKQSSEKKLLIQERQLIDFTKYINEDLAFSISI